MPNEFDEELLAELHASGALTPADLAPVLRTSEDEIAEAVERLIDEGRIERQGDQLVPAPGSHPTPGIFVANEREDARPMEVDDREDPA